MQTQTDLQTPEVKNDSYQTSAPFTPFLIDKDALHPQLTATENALVAHYRALLAKEASEAKWRKPAETAAAKAYFEQAAKVHMVGGNRVNIFAPFDFATSALRTFCRHQIITLAIIGLVLLIALILNSTLTISVVMALIVTFYCSNLLITFILSFRVFDKSGEIEIPDKVIRAIDSVEWPRYTILCPLYKEAAVVQQFADAMQKLDYPTNKLQILFLTEEDDESTRDAIRAAKLPSHFEIITVPDGQPRTKPRACNYGLLKATGDFIVIFDAEDVPDSLQLKKAVLAFAESSSDLGCLQAKLNFYNSRQNILTRLFTIEYSTWFDATLPGLQWGQFALPLGGTSNHFRVSTLREVGAWDAYNVTEDCDLGLRLAAAGYRTMVLDSTTYEEANPNIKNWIRQRSRWIKGYMQTYLIYMRQPFRYTNPLKWRNFISMQLIVGGRTAVLLINPIMWLLFALFFVFRDVPAFTKIYQTFFPGIVLYFAVACLIFGNLTYIYTHFIGCFKRGEMGLVKWTLLMPAYWILGSYAAFKALYQLITKPHYWEKTNHGLHFTHQQNFSIPDSQTATTITPGAINLNTDSHNLAVGKQWLLESETEETELAPFILFEAERSNAGNASNGNALHMLQYNQNYQQDTSPTSRVWALESVYSETPISIPKPAPTHHARPLQTLQLFAKRIFNQQNPYQLATFILACAAGLLATIHYFQTHELLIYADAVSHLGIARLIFDDAKPGLNHLGGVWLPLQHLLLTPFTVIDYLYLSGLAGACVSMPCFVAASLYVFAAAQRLTKSSIISFIGSLVFVLNPNMLYLQATPLTDSLAILMVTATAYYFLAWLQEEKPKYLFLLALTTFLATLSRYDGWGLFAVLCIFVPAISWYKHRQRPFTEAYTLVYVFLSGIGTLLWVLWCWAIFGDPLYFLHAVTTQAGTDPTYHNLLESLRYLLALSAVAVGPAIFALGLVGLTLALIRYRSSYESLAILIFLTPFGFYLFSIYVGQINIGLPEFGRAAYANTRYGVVILASAAIFVAIAMQEMVLFYNAHIRNRMQPARLKYQVALPILGVGLVLGQTFVTSRTGVIALEDGQSGSSCLQDQAIVDYLMSYYDGGKILVNFYANYSLYALGPSAGIDYKNLVYQSSGLYWKHALQNPASVDWIIVDYSSENDPVAKAVLASTSDFLMKFSEVARESYTDRRLYRKNGLPVVANRRIAEPFAQIANQGCKRY